MSGARLDLGPQVDEFIREFDCDPSARETIYNMLATPAPPELEDGSNQMIQRVCQKMSKKHPSLGKEVTELIGKIRNSDLKRPDDVIAFILERANAESVARKSQRKARLAVLNETPNGSSVYSLPSTPKLGILPPKFSPPVLLDNCRGVRFAEADVKQERVLTGRAKSHTVVDEHELIAALLSALVGIEGRYIVKSAVDGTLIIAPSCSIADALHSQFLRLLPFGNHYIRLEEAAKRTSPNLIIQAFYSCIPELLTEYSGVIAEQYSKFMTSSGLSALEIIMALDEWQPTMGYFLTLSQKCAEYSGVQLVNATYAMYCGTVSGTLLNRRFEAALRTMLAIFHESLRHWLFYGNLKHNSEWMIAVDGDCTQKNPWTTRYKIIEDAVPIMFKSFEKLCKKILIIGRSVGLLQSLGVEDRFLNERKRLVDAMEPVKLYLHIQEATRFFHVISRIYNQINGEVIHEMLNKYRIRDHIDTVQKHFFLTDELFARTFYSQIREATEDDLMKLDSQRAWLALANTMGLCSSFPVELADSARIEATCGVMEEGGQILPSPRDSSGYPILRLRYITPVPVSIIFSESAMRRYDRVFRFIWQIVCVDFRLAEVAETQSSLYGATVKNWPELAEMCRLFAAVFVRMGYLLSMHRNYINTVIKDCTKKLAVQFERESCGDLVHMVEAHRRYLSDVEDGLFLSEDCKAVRTAILATLDSITDGIRGFSKFEAELKTALATKGVLDERSRLIKAAGGSDLEDTRVFEVEEGCARLEAAKEAMVTTYRTVVRNANAKFELLANDIAEALSGLDRTPHTFLYQHLSFGDFHLKRSQ